MIWLHIGTKKTGTTALQHYLSSHTDVLKNHGFTYICPGRKSSCNALAIAINRNRIDECAAIGRDLSNKLENRSTEHAVLSSEMLYGIDPHTLFETVPALGQNPLQVLVYLRRQDQYLESSYLQKRKNGRFKGTIQDYLKRFDGSGADYWAHLKAWRSCDRATLVPRVAETKKLVGGTIVRDFCALLGLPPSDAQAATVNVSPSMARIQLLETLADLSGLRLRAIQRTLARDYPTDPSQKAVFLTPAERADLAVQYAECNEKLRQRFFPDQSQLFASDGLDADPKNTSEQIFSDAQLAEVRALLQSLHKVHFR